MGTELNFSEAAVGTNPLPGSILQQELERVVFRLTDLLAVDLELRPSIARPNLYTWDLALATAERAQGRDVIDMGCGTGAAGLIAGQAKARSVLCLDVAESAVSLTLANASVNALDDLVTARASDWLSAVSASNFSDPLVITAPPHTPRPDRWTGGESQDDSHAISSYGGEDGLDAIRQILDDVGQFDEFQLLIGLAEYQRLPIEKLCNNRGLKVSTVSRRPVSLSPLALELRRHIERVTGYVFEPSTAGGLGASVVLSIVRKRSAERKMSSSLRHVSLRGLYEGLL